MDKKPFNDGIKNGTVKLIVATIVPINTDVTKAILWFLTITILPH